MLLCKRLLEEYLNPETRRHAVATFLKQITRSLRNVTTETEDFETLKLYWALRRLYLPVRSQTRLSFEQKQKMTRAFAEGWPAFKNVPEIVELCKRVKAYTGLLQDYGVHDYMVAKSFVPQGEAGRVEGEGEAGALKIQKNIRKNLRWTLLHRTFLLLLFMAIVLPTTVLAFMAGPGSA
eukprot:g7215.t1